jgi:hypothetical protein
MLGAGRCPVEIADRVGVAAGKGVGAGNSVTSCDLGIFMDQAAEAIPALDTHTGPFSGWMCAASGRVLLQRPVLIVVVGVLGQDQPQVPFAGDQHPVQALAAGTAHPAFRDCVRTRRPDWRLDDLHPGCGEDRVKGDGELGVPIPDEGT